MTIEEIESQLYGEYSVNVAKTHKLISSILILVQNYQMALKYLERSSKVFKEHGYKK